MTNFKIAFIKEKINLFLNIFINFYPFKRTFQKCCQNCKVKKLKVFIDLRFFLKTVQPSSLPPLSVRDMFIYSRKPHDLFGIVGYDVPKKYCDPLKNMKDREYLNQKKGQKSKAKIKDKYFDSKPKVSPGPNVYNIMKPWVDEKEKRSKSVLSKTRNVSKYTYIDKIFLEAKRVKTPGPGSYNPYNEEPKKSEKASQKMKKYITFKFF